MFSRELEIWGKIMQNLQPEINKRYSYLIKLETNNEKQSISSKQNILQSSFPHFQWYNGTSNLPQLVQNMLQLV